jgi:hypothetical protein
MEAVYQQIQANFYILQFGGQRICHHQATSTYKYIIFNGISLYALFKIVSKQTLLSSSNEKILKQEHT